MNKAEIERFAIMETEIVHIKTALEDNNRQHGEIKTMIQEFINTADTKYASKTVEKAFYWATGVVTVTIIGIIGFLLKYALFGGIL